MALTAEDPQAPIHDDWDEGAHTQFENAVCAMLKYLLAKYTYSQQEMNEAARMFPYLWGH